MINQKIKPFSNEAFDPKTGSFITVTEKSLEGKWNIVCQFPLTFTFNCPTELSDLADFQEELEALGVGVYSLSVDSHFNQKAWHDVSEAVGTVKYPMIGDIKGELIRSLGGMNEETGVGYRVTYIIDPDGVVVAADMTTDAVARDASEAVRKLKAAMYVRNNPGEVCPAKWREGADTIAPSIDLVGKI